MHLHQSSLNRTWRHPAALPVGLVLLVLLSLVWVTSARAADGSQYSLGQYGEVPTARFGGFDATWFDHGAYDGSGSETAPTPGKILFPVGFAVDTTDPVGTAVYVLDRVSAPSTSTTEPGTRWRLQKFSDTGAILAKTEFFLPKAGPQPGDPASTVEPVGLTVAGGSVYTVLAGSIEHGVNVTRFAEEIIGWSTTPTGGILEPATATADTVSTPVTADSVTYPVPSVISTEADLQSTPLYDPRGLAAAGNGFLAVLGDSEDRFAAGSPGAAPALVERISSSDGQTSTTWSSSSVSGLDSATAAGISASASNGDLDLLLAPSSGSTWIAVDLTPDLSAATVLEDAGLSSPNIQGAPVITGSGIALTGGLDLARLSNGLYAAPLIESSSEYWTNQDAIRLTSPLANGTLSSPTGPATTTYDTLAKAPSGACDISEAGSSGLANGGIALAAGADGSVWMLNYGKDSGDAHSGREVAEFSPGAADPCVAPPAGTTFSLGAASSATPPTHLASEGPLTVPVGTKVRFSTEPFEYPTVFTENPPYPAYVYAFEWDPIGGAAGDTGYSLIQWDSEGLGYIWPPGTTESFSTTEDYTYTAPGTYSVKMKALGELGEYDATATVVVQTSSPPTAAFTLPGTGTTNTAVSLSASGSTPASGAQIANYHWSFGDGREDDTQTPSETHSYAAAGTYTVTLTVRDNDNQQSTAVTHQITISAPSTGTDTGTGTGTGTGTTTTPPTTTTTPPVTGTSTPKPSAAAQQKKKLATALKACKKKKPGKPRKACEKTARAKYSAKSKKKK